MDTLEERRPGQMPGCIHPSFACTRATRKLTRKSLPGTGVPQERFALAVCSAGVETRRRLPVPANPAEVGKYVRSHFTDG